MRSRIFIKVGNRKLISSQKSVHGNCYGTKGVMKSILLSKKTCRSPRRWDLYWAVVIVDHLVFVAPSVLLSVENC